MQPNDAAADSDRKAPPIKTSEFETYVKIWSKAVDTQMHFNEMSAKSRQLGLTFATAALGVAILLLSKHEDFLIHLDAFGFECNLSGAGFIVLATALAVYAVKILDLNVYHRMLRGAVAFGEDFERNYFTQIVQLDLGMTQAISHFSRHSDASVDKSDAKYQYTGSKLKSAGGKITLFYRVAITALCIIAVVIFVATSSFERKVDTPEVLPTKEGKSGVPAKNK